MKADATTSRLMTPSRASEASSARVVTFLELTKPRVTTLVILTTMAGFYMATTETLNVFLLLHLIVGTSLVAAGTAALNQVMERGPDARMRRTAIRPLPSGRLDPVRASLFAVVLLSAGTVYLWVNTHWLTSFLGLLTAGIYLLGYTPLKTRTSYCTMVGAFPGAIPPLMGWAAVRGDLNWEALALFAVLFFWQFPHFLAISWIYRADYERGGFNMLPKSEGDGRRTARRIANYSLLLMLASLLPFGLGMAGSLYAVFALLLSGIFVAICIAAAQSLTDERALRILKASVVYLPLLLILLVLDKT